jgi:histone H3/H4
MKTFKIKLLYVVLVSAYCLTVNVYAQSKKNSLQEIFAEIETLENKSDPKCYATASRLEDFIYGTPLTDPARFTKNILQKKWAKNVWSQASKLAQQQNKSAVSMRLVEQVIKNIFRYQVNSDGHWLVTFSDGTTLTINKNDKRQYGSIAYSLRAILAVQQESLMDMQSLLLPLTQPAVSQLKESLDLYTLVVLSIADNQARINSQHELSKGALLQTWGQFESEFIQATVVSSNNNKATMATLLPYAPIQLDLLARIIDQKVRSFEKYNDINNQLFIRNLQVYFARATWPKDKKEGQLFKQLFTETLIAFSADLYKGAEQHALKNGHKTITEADVKYYINTFIPHQINEYEDALFFPRLAKKEQVFIESYDMDAFRDSGIHWSYMKFALLDANFQAHLAPDPFATELLAENIAQFGVLLLRVTGDVAKQSGQKRIKVEHFVSAIEVIQNRISQHALVNNPVNLEDAGIKSAVNTEKNKAPNKTLFTDITAKMNIDMQHHSSDWLNRLLRSYLKKDENTGIITIPPAFGGSGIAAEDINNDGLADLLILSGSGNRLYLNKKDHFQDITQQSGLVWKREQDNRPGEPRQPLIADINNDGLQDIVVTYVDDSHRVYKNIGEGKFVDVTAQSNLGGKGLVAGPATIFDYDNDGLLDIYITYFGDYLQGVLPTLKRRNTNGLPNKLFRNIGDFKFIDVTENSGLDDSGWGQAVAHTDFDGDGWQDIIVGNDFGVNGYYRNLGNGKFIDLSSEMGTDKPSYTMGIGITDLNDDLVPDIYISNIVTMNKDQKYVLPNEGTTMLFDPEKLANMRVIEANDLFVSTKNGAAMPNYQASKAVERGLSSTGWAWDADFFDFDNDGDDDLYVLNGMNEYNLYSSENPYYRDPIENKKLKAYMPVAELDSNVFFINEGGKLRNISEKSGADLLSNSRSATYLDVENDGDLDMVLNNYHGPVVVYRNNSEQFLNHWLKVKLIGAPEQGINRDAIGARIIVEMEGGGRVWREVHGSNGYMSVHPKEQQFGVGKAEQVKLTVLWPNGKRTEMPNVKTKQLVVVNYNTLH